MKVLLADRWRVALLEGAPLPWMSQRPGSCSKRWKKGSEADCMEPRHSLRPFESMAGPFKRSVRFWPKRVSKEPVSMSLGQFR